MQAADQLDAGADQLVQAVVSHGILQRCAAYDLLIGPALAPS